MFDNFFPNMGYIRYPMYIAAVLMLVAIALAALDLRKPVDERSSMRTHVILVWGFLNALLGFLGTVVGLALAGASVESMGAVGPALLAGGLKVALYPTIFGLLLLTVAVVAWLILQVLRRGGEARAAG